MNIPMLKSSWYSNLQAYGTSTCTMYLLVLQNLQTLMEALESLDEMALHPWHM